ncbi:MAG: hypothetical protein U5K72_17610 [Balneolaceae bacterium]|nr:hypothetical protein [Balneolaceae bacterium]
MDYIIFFSIVNLILISRLRLTMRDDGISGRKDLFWLTIIPLLILPFLSVNLSWFLLALYLLIRPLVLTFLERSNNRLNRNRIFTLSANILVIGLLASPLFEMRFAYWSETASEWLIDIFLMEESFVDWLYFNAVLFGLLMVLNESNIAIRFTLEKLNLAPLSNDHHKIDDEQFQTGRVIGFLERIFVFLFILLNQYTAIGFIIAAKGIVRYPDFGKKSFNEYILIGTLISVLFAMFSAYATKIFL